MKEKTYIRLIELIFLAIGIILLMITGSFMKPILFSIIVAYLLNPFVEWLERRKVNKRIAILLSLTFSIFVFVMLFVYIVPITLKDGPKMVDSINGYIDKILKTPKSRKYDALPIYIYQHKPNKP